MADKKNNGRGVPPDPFKPLADGIMGFNGSLPLETPNVVSGSGMRPVLRPAGAEALAAAIPPAAKRQQLPTVDMGRRTQGADPRAINRKQKGS